MTNGTSEYEEYDHPADEFCIKNLTPLSTGSVAVKFHDGKEGIIDEVQLSVLKGLKYRELSLGHGGAHESLAMEIRSKLRAPGIFDQLGEHIVDRAGLKVDLNKLYPLLSDAWFMPSFELIAVSFSDGFSALIPVESTFITMHLKHASGFIGRKADLTIVDAWHSTFGYSLVLKTTSQPGAFAIRVDWLRLAIDPNCPTLPATGAEHRFGDHATERN